jgi:hypothetical protein
VVWTCRGVVDEAMDAESLSVTFGSECSCSERVEWGKRVTASGRGDKVRMQIDSLGHAPLGYLLPNRTFGGDSAGVGEELERIRFGLWYDGASISFHRVIS